MVFHYAVTVERSRDVGGGTTFVGRCFGTMATSENPTPPPPNKPLVPKAVDGLVVVVDPPADPLTLTADAAEISGIRLLDAADQARKRA